MSSGSFGERRDERNLEMMENTQPSLPIMHASGSYQTVILVVDDEVLVRNLVTMLLQGAGYTVLSATDGQEGLELSRTYPGKIELVVTDFRMPHNDMSLIVRFLEERPGIKSIVMSGPDINGIVSQEVRVQLLAGPVDGEALLERVRAILGASVQGPKESAARPSEFIGGISRVMLEYDRIYYGLFCSVPENAVHH
jgi:CheY-like chemotaxis protein